MKKLFEGNIRKNFFIYAFPLILTALLSQSYNFINTYMAGHFLGDTGISSVGSVTPFSTLISSLCWGYVTGFSIYVATLYGRNEYKSMINVIKTNILITSLVIVCFSISCILFKEPIFNYLNIEHELKKDASIYFIIIMAGLVINHQVWIGVYVANAIGITMFPFVASFITSFLNILGNYILIKYFNLGVAGIALSTLISNFITAIFYYIVLGKAFLKMGCVLSGIYFDRKEISTSFKFGFPTMLQQSVMYICTMVTSPLTNSCGSNAIAGYTVGMRLYDLNAAVYQNSNKTVSNYIAQCIGGEKYHLLKKGIKTGIIQTGLFLLPFLAITVFGAEFFGDLFLDNEEGISYASSFMKFCMPFVVFNVINNLMHAIFRSMGAGKILVCSTVVYSLTRIIFSYLLFGRYKMYGIFAAIVLSWIIESIYGLGMYFFGNWKNNIKTKIF